MYDHCHMYVRNTSFDDIINTCASSDLTNSSTANLQTVKCEDYHYEKSHYTNTIVTQVCILKYLSEREIS